MSDTRAQQKGQDPLQSLSQLENGSTINTARHIADFSRPCNFPVHVLRRSATPPAFVRSLVALKADKAEEVDKAGQSG
jgi:hypothetical protein